MQFLVFTEGTYYIPGRQQVVTSSCFEKSFGLIAQFPAEAVQHVALTCPAAGGGTVR